MTSPYPAHYPIADIPNAALPTSPRGQCFGDKPRSFANARSVGEMLLAGAAIVLWSPSARAQVTPGGFAGQASQRVKTAPPTVQEPSKPSPLPSGTPGSADLRGTMRTDERVMVKSIRFSGNKALSATELQAVLPQLKADGLTIADLDATADAVTTYYRSKGYPFARALFQPQQSADGIIEMSIFEGQFGKVSLQDRSRLHESKARPMLAYNLCGVVAGECHGAAITDRGLQRAALLLSDLPGVAVTSAFSRGEEVGTADMAVDVTGTKPVVFTLGGDNFGTSSTGTARGALGVTVNEPLGIGDRLDLSLIGTGKRLWNVGGAYSFFVGPSGLRVGVSAAHTHYRLGDAFTVLDANGIADIVSPFIAYPVVRSINANLSVGAGYDYKRLHDNIGLIGTRSRSSLNNINLTLAGDETDHVLGGGVTHVNITVTHGWLHFGDALSVAQDQDPMSGLHSRGGFTKVSYNVDRQQAIEGGLSLFGTIHGQWSNDNLSSAERIYVGGPNGVRAYSVGEGGGDSAAITTAELRYTLPVRVAGTNLLTGGAFYDHAWVRRNADPLPSNTDNNVQFGGAGARLTLERPGRFSVTAMWASQLGGRRSQVQPGKTDHFWVQTALQF